MFGHRFLFVFGLIMGTAALVSCGSDGALVGEGVRVVGVVHSFATDGLPPESHESRRLSIDGSTFRAVRQEQYGEIVVSDVGFEIDEDVVEELNEIVQAARLRTFEPVTDECTGTHTYSVRLSFDDGSTVSLFQDSRTYGGESGRCKDYNVAGDLSPIVRFLLDLEDQA